MKRRYELREYLSKKTGLPLYDEITTTIDDFYSNNKGSVWVIKDNHHYSVSRIQVKGGKWKLKIGISSFDSPLRFDTLDWDYPFDKVYIRKERYLDDFGVKYKVKKEAYRESEGGGGYSNHDIIIIDGIEFVNI